MLDPANTRALDLSDLNGYIGSCLEICRKRLADFESPARVANSQYELNKYPRLDQLEPPREIFVINNETVGRAEQRRAAEVLLEGGVLLEHTCAGEATRLGLGTKYLINPRIDLSPKVLIKLLGEDYQLAVAPDKLRPISLGRRHMLQLAWDISQLAEEHGMDPEEALLNQTLLIIMNEASHRSVLEDFIEAGFYGFDRFRVLFMVQKSFHGITVKDGKWLYDTQSPRRLHNHGQMVMQTAMDRQVFRLDENGRSSYLTWPEYRMVLDDFEDKVSFNIEDLDYLGMSLDLTGLATALKLGDEGYSMVMEVVKNNPEHPQKGGMCAWDAGAKRNVMIESFQLAGIENAEITHLNKNINHYPGPSDAATAVRQKGLSMPVAVKNDYIYFQPVQGDINFLLPTAFVRREEMRPISAWKNGDTTDAALSAMYEQENRPGFMAWASELTGLNL